MPMHTLQRDARYFPSPLTFMPEPPSGVSRDNLPPELLNRPSLFDALRQQLGLKLHAEKGPVEYYIIDHIDRPSDN